jgi:hypothetical protein
MPFMWCDIDFFVRLSEDLHDDDDDDDDDDVCVVYYVDDDDKDERLCWLSWCRRFCYLVFVGYHLSDNIRKHA